MRYTKLQLHMKLDVGSQRIPHGQQSFFSVGRHAYVDCKPHCAGSCGDSRAHAGNLACGVTDSGCGERFYPSVASPGHTPLRRQRYSSFFPEFHRPFDLVLLPVEEPTKTVHSLV